MTKNILVATLLLLTRLLSAQTFPCDDKMYFFRYDANGNKVLSHISNYTTGNPVFTDLYTMSCSTFNALAANPADGYLYFRNGNMSTDLYRLNSLNNNMGNPICNSLVNTGAVSGCFDHLGRYWYIALQSGVAHLYAIDVANSCNVIAGPFPLPGPPPFYDIAFNLNNCMLYYSKGSTNNSVPKEIYCIDLSGAIQGQFSVPDNYGGLAFGPNGMLYGLVDNSTGSDVLVEIDVQTQTTSTICAIPNGLVPTYVDMASFTGCNLNVSASFSVNTPVSCGVPATVSFSNSSQGNANYFIWDFDDGSPYDYSSNPVHVYTTPGSYTITLTAVADTVCGNIYMDTATITITIHPLPTITIAGPDSVCSGSSVLLTAGGTLNYAWSNGQTGNSIVVPPQVTTTYYVVGSDGTCQDTAWFTVTVLSVLSAFSSNEVTGSNPFTIAFQNNSIGAVSYLWYFGDGNTSSVTNPLHTFASPGEYTIMLIATNALGCSDTSYMEIMTGEENQLWVPNAFTPDGDGINPVFTVAGLNIADIKLDIFNRWGERIYNSAGRNAGWDGTVSGVAAPQGIYIYLLEVGFEGGRTVKKTGHVTLVR